VNTDGAVQGSPILVACVGIFRGSHGKYIGRYFYFFGNHNALYAEIMGAILTIEHA